MIVVKLRPDRNMYMIWSGDVMQVGMRRDITVSALLMYSPDGSVALIGRADRYGSSDQISGAGHWNSAGLVITGVPEAFLPRGHFWLYGLAALVDDHMRCAALVEPYGKNSPIC